MAHASAATKPGEPGRDIARAIVRQDSADADAVAAKPRPGAPQKLRGGHPALIGQHFDVGQTGGVVHGHVDVLPADPAHPAPAIPADAMAHAPNAPQLLDVEMQQAAGPRPLIALHRDRGLELPQAPQALAPEQAGDRRGAELQHLGDLRPRPALPAQTLHPAHQQPRGGSRTPARPTRPIGQARLGLGRVAGQPLAHRPFADPHRGGHRGWGLFVGQDPRHDLASTPRRRPGILMDVHPGLLLCGDGWSATTTVAETARMDNLLAVQS